MEADTKDGFDNTTVVTVWHKFASVTVTTYAPAVMPVDVAVICPLDHR